MKALTVSQPWANLIASGLKFVENRTWPTSYRGPLAIHAGKGSQYLTPQQLTMYPTGCIVATCDLVHCVHIREVAERIDKNEHIKPIGPNSNKTVQDVFWHDFTEGPYLWILDNIRPVVDHPIKGAQGLWNVSVDVQCSLVTAWEKTVRLVDRGDVLVQYRIQPTREPARREPT